MTGAAVYLTCSTMLHLLPAQVLLAYQSRSSRVDSLLFSMLQRAFDLRPAERLPGEPDRGKIDLHWLRRKAGQ